MDKDRRNREADIMLLAAIPWLMICIVPVSGIEYRFSWQLAALWLAGCGYALWLSGWWLRLFWLLALVRTATIMPPSAESYISLVTIAAFLAFAERFRRMDPDRVMDWIALAGLVLASWMAAQKLGWLYTPQGSIVGPFNTVSAGVFLAMCLPAYLRKGWLLGIPVTAWGLAVAGSSTGFLAATAGVAVWLAMELRNQRRWLLVGLAGLVLAGGFWFWRVDPIASIPQCNRWIAWHHAARSIPADPFGRGLGSWAAIFPLIASGDARVGSVENTDSGIDETGVFLQAHNEYVQAAFELGLPALALILAFLAAAAAAIWRGKARAEAAAGIAALAVGCFGWMTFHVAPLALIGVAWIGIWEGRAER